MSDAGAQRADVVAIRRTTLAIAAVVLVLLAAGAGYAGGRFSTLFAASPSGDSVEAGFARDMRTHHDQGVEMALLVRDRSTDEAVRTLAYDIATTQGNQSGQMLGWLNVWGLPAFSADGSMAWMPGHAHGSAMPGLATPAQIEALTDASGTDADRLFLELMIAHHRGAAEMAEAALPLVDDPTVTALATGIVTSQNAEIQLMEGLLADLPA